MKKEFGAEAMQKFLKEELEHYLRSRADESKFEKPLLDNNNQDYIWYRKGGLILYSLQDLIEESNLNNDFKAYTDASKFSPEVPFTKPTELYNYIKSATPDSLKYYLEDSLKKITMCSNKVTAVTYKILADEKHEVTINVESAKNHFDGTREITFRG
jgi:hypothetical protein